MSDDVDAGKATCSCKESPDSCMLCVDFAISHSKNAKKQTYELCHNQLKTFHVVDQSAKLDLGESTKIQLFGSLKGEKSVQNKNTTETKTGKRFKLITGKEKPANVDITIHSRCSIKPEECPQGLFYLNYSKDTAWPVANTYQGEIPYNVPEVEVTFALYDLITTLFKEKEPQPTQILSGGVNQYLLSIAKMHEEGSIAPTLENGQLTPSLYGMKTLAFVYVYPKLGADLTFYIKDRESSKEILSDSDKKALQTAIDDDRYGSENRARPDSSKRKRYKRLNELASHSSYKFGVSGNVTVGGTTLQADIDKTVEHMSQSFERINKYKDVLEIADKILGPTKGGKPTIHTEWLLPELEMGLKMELSNANDYLSAGYDWSASLSAKPLIGGKLVADIIQLFATYYGVAKEIAKMRKELEKNPNANVSARLDFVLEGDTDVTVELEKKHNIDKADINMPEVTVNIKPFLIVDIKGEIKAWVVSAVFQVKVVLDTIFHFIFKYDKDKQDFIALFYHGGAKATLKVEAKVKIGDKGKGGTYEKEWVIYEPLSKAAAKTIYSYKGRA